MKKIVIMVTLAVLLLSMANTASAVAYTEFEDGEYLVEMQGFVAEQQPASAGPSENGDPINVTATVKKTGSNVEIVDMAIDMSGISMGGSEVELVDLTITHVDPYKEWIHVEFTGHVNNFMDSNNVEFTGTLNLYPAITTLSAPEEKYEYSGQGSAEFFVPGYGNVYLGGPFTATITKKVSEPGCTLPDGWHCGTVQGAVIAGPNYPNVHYPLKADYVVFVSGDDITIDSITVTEGEFTISTVNAEYDDMGDIVVTAQGQVEGYPFEGIMHINPCNMDVSSRGTLYLDNMQMDLYGKFAFTPRTCQSNEIPEFPTIALPVIAVLGLAFIMQRRKD
ncbi:PEF-CTERM sorting domain-containing protein [Methanolobus sp. WCC5]|uniref:PEF-CTERM sorting domain-containing protein n=1 Tax=Methanolobus sp. WCC5 TaxID=3125785 RepID=UPI00324BCE82